MIADNRVVSIHYTLKNEDGETLQSTSGDDAFSFLFGHGNVIPGLEEVLDGKDVGFKETVTIAPDKAYGHYNEGLKTRIPAKRLKPYGKLVAGQQVNLQTEHGPRMVTIVKVGRYTVDIDGNHPLVGQTLTFDLEVTDIRDATEEELSHGHAHGPGGHQH